MRNSPAPKAGAGIGVGPEVRANASGAEAGLVGHLAADNSAGVVSADSLAMFAATPADQPAENPAVKAAEKAEEKAAAAELDKRAALVHEAEFLLGKADFLIQTRDTSRMANSAACFHDPAFRSELAGAIADVMLFYDLTGPELLAHPLCRLALAAGPLAFAAWLDYKIFKAQQAAELEKKKDAPPPREGTEQTLHEAAGIGGGLAPPSDLHKRV